MRQVEEDEGMTAKEITIKVEALRSEVEKQLEGVDAESALEYIEALQTELAGMEDCLRDELGD